MIHFVRITAATVGIIIGTLLPFLPGQYDSLAVPLSLMAQIFGKVGLLLVPIGALWVASRHWSWLAGKQYGVAIVSLIASSVVWFIVSLGALATSGPLLGLGAIALGVYVVSRAASHACYIYWPYKADVMYWFCKPSAAHRTHHLHLVPFKSSLWFDRLRFKDALRNDSKLAERYAELKLHLAKHYRTDREAFTEGKTEFVTAVLAGQNGR